MAHLWSGRFDGDPDARALRVRRVVPLRSAAVRRRRARQPARGRRRSRAPACCRPADAAAIERGLARHSREGGERSGVRQRGARRRGRPRVRRARAGRAHRRRRPAAAHRPIAQRAGRRRSAAVPEAPHPGDAARDRAALVEALARSGGARGRRADAVVHAPAPRAAGAGRALPAVALPRRFAAIIDAPRRACCDEADELPLGSGAIAGTSYAIDVARARPRARLLARRRQQHRRQRRSRLRRVVPARGVAGDGASEPARRGLHPVHVRGVRASSSWPTPRPPAAA